MNNIRKSKIQKKKNVAIEFAADNLDNTAPVKKILFDLLDKNRKALAFYYQTVRPRRSAKENTYHSSLTGHPLYAFSDDWDGDLSSGYFEPFAYKSSMPKIITSPCYMERNDPVTEAIKFKKDWSNECRNLRKFVVGSSLMESYEELNEEVIRCPKHFVDMAAHFDSDPDPYFEESYNWYYAGNGNMHLICIDWVDYLLHSEFSTLHLTPFSKQQMSLKTCTASFDCKDNIFETVCSPNNIVALRTKNRIVILRIVSTNDEMMLEKIKEVGSELPFTSISFDLYHKNILYITSLNSKVTILNLDRITGRTVQLRAKTKTLVNNWNAVITSQRVIYTHVSRNCISIYDKRTNKVCNSWSALRNISDHLDCNDITAAKQFEGSQALYYGTDHHLILMDLRHQHKSKLTPLARWTHGMQCAPTYISLCNFEFNKELLCLSSQWCEDTCVLPNYNIGLLPGGEISGITLPFRPPSLLDTLNEAREKSLCFNLYNSIDNRISTSVTGQLLTENGENYIILTQNALGDISSHIIYPEHMESFVEDDGIQHLHEWSQLYKNDTKEFQVSDVTDISRLWRNLNKIPSIHRFVDTKIVSKEQLDLREKEVNDTFEDGHLDSGLLDLWSTNNNETVGEDSSLAMHLYYSDESHSDE